MGKAGMMKTGIIYLAAGNSRRFGTNKLLYEIDERPMYQHLLRRLVRLCQDCPRWKIAVVTQYDEIYAYVSWMEEKGLPVQPVFSPDSKKGAACSIQAGLRVFDQEADACAFFAADQPGLTKKSAQRFLLEMEKRKAKLGCVCSKGLPGNPAWFSREYYPELFALSGDMGGRSILKKYPGEVCLFEIEDGRELADMDEPMKKNSR